MNGIGEEGEETLSVCAEGEGKLRDMSERKRRPAVKRVSKAKKKIKRPEC